MTFQDTLDELAASIAAQPDPGYAHTHRFHTGAPVTDGELDARERALGLTYPPSYRDAVRAHGLFTLGSPDAQHDHLAFKCWPLDQHRTALAEYAEQLECEPTAAAVSEQIGVEEDHVAALGQVLLVGLEGHEDYIGFDLRTRNPKTGECSFGLVLFDDTEISALAEEATEPCAARGFDEWLAKHVERRK